MDASRRVMVLAVFFATAAFAPVQPPEDRPPPGQPQEARQPEDRASYRARLERSLVDARQRQERIEGAIKRLDEGVPVEDVRREQEALRPPGSGGGRRFQGPEPRRGPDQGPQGVRLTREEVVVVIESFSPEIATRFKDALKDTQGPGGRIIDRVEPMVREIKAERDAEMRLLRIENFKNGFELVNASRAFAEAHRADPASGTTGEKAANLRKLLGAHVDLRVQMHQKEIVMLERRITQLREDLSRQVENRDSFIEKRIEDVKRGFKGRGEREPKPVGEAPTPPKR